MVAGVVGVGECLLLAIVGVCPVLPRCDARCYVLAGLWLVLLVPSVVSCPMCVVGWLLLVVGCALWCGVARCCVLFVLVVVLLVFVGLCVVGRRAACALVCLLDDWSCGCVCLFV